LKVSGFGPGNMPYPATEKPPVGEAFFGSGLTIQADRETHFKKEIDLAFPLPNFADAPADKRPPRPEDAFYHLYRRLEGPNGSVMFEVIDTGKVECPNGATSCPDADKKVVTASYPFTGYADGWSSWDPTEGGQFR